MREGQRVREADIGAAHLLERKVEITILLLLDAGAQLPLDQVGGHAIGLAHPRAIERLQLVEALLGERRPAAAEFGGFWRQLLLELVLFGAREKPRRRGLVRIRPDPLGREVVEEIRNGTRTGHRLLGGDAERAGQQNENREPFHEST